MKKFKSLVILMALICLPFSDISALNVGGKELVKNGVGKRTMLITVYYATLWVTPDMKGKSGKDIIEADKAMSVTLKVDTRAMTREKFLKAAKKGFDKAASSGYATDKNENFLKLFDGLDINKYDVITMSYVPGKGLEASFKSAETGKTKILGTIPGLQFKKALYAIWLGPKPVQESCKDGMLGQ